MPYWDQVAIALLWSESTALKEIDYRIVTRLTFEQTSSLCLKYGLVRVRSNKVFMSQEVKYWFHPSVSEKGCWRAPLLYTEYIMYNCNWECFFLYLYLWCCFHISHFVLPTSPYTLFLICTVFFHYFSFGANKKTAPSYGWSSYMGGRNVVMLDFIWPLSAKSRCPVMQAWKKMCDGGGGV